MQRIASCNGTILKQKKRINNFKVEHRSSLFTLRSRNCADSSTSKVVTNILNRCRDGTELSKTSPVDADTLRNCHFLKEVDSTAAI